MDKEEKLEPEEHNHLVTHLAMAEIHMMMMLELAEADTGADMALLTIMVEAAEEALMYREHLAVLQLMVISSQTLV